MSKEITSKETDKVIDFVHTSGMFSSNPIDDCPKCKCPIYFACPNCIMKALELQYIEGKNVQRTKDLELLSVIDKLSEEELAEEFHRLYEKSAKVYGWETNKKCKTSFWNLPEANRKTMISVMILMKDFIRKKIIKEVTDGAREE